MEAWGGNHPEEKRNKKTTLKCKRKFQNIGPNNQNKKNLNHPSPNKSL